MNSNMPSQLAAPAPATRTPLDATSAYYRAMPGVGLMRFVLKGIERVWPALAVGAAYKVFLTPLPFKWLNRGKPWGEEWHRQSWPFEHATITLHSLQAEGPAVLLVHGWGGNAGQMRPLALALAASGLRPVILDMPGHGRSAGWQSSLPQFARAIDYVTARLGQGGSSIRALVAHSLGATAGAYAAGRQLPVDKLVLLAPVASPSGYTKMFAHVFALSERTRAAMQARIEARQGALMRHFEPDVAGSRIRVPMLVVHDQNDSVNRFAEGQAFVNAVAGAELMATEGLGHRAILKDAGVIARVAAFIGDA